MRSIISFLLLFLGLSVVSFAQKTGAVSGILIDDSNGEPLAFANVAIESTSLGTVTNDEGKFTIPNIPTGEYTLILRYVGYETREIPVTIEAGQKTNIGDVALKFESILGEEVIVTGIMRGQASAINQQVKSNKIMNVVSKEKIEEVPDVNAAESLSRLPGITISRSGGEGNKVTVRGVSPRFNTVTVNGQTMPATGIGDRSVNLSVISSDILDGIEVYKALTPDMDADAVGGTVNLVTKTADEGLQGKVQVESGYHSLIDNIGNYKGSFTIGNRFLDNKLGIITGANYFNANRNVDTYNGDYELTGNGDYRGNSAAFNNRLENRIRFGGSFTADYQFDFGGLVFDFLHSKTSRVVHNRSKRARPTISALSIGYGYNENDISLTSTNLRGDFKLWDILELDFTGGYSKTSNVTPVSYGTGAEQESGLLPEADDAQPLDMYKYARTSLEEFFGGEGFGYSDNSMYDENFTGQVDLLYPFNPANWLSGSIKIGGKIKDKNRERIVNSYGVPDYTAYELAFREQFPHYTRNGTVYPTSNFIDPDYETYDSPFELHNDIPFVFDADKIRSHYEVMSGLDDIFRRIPTNDFDQYKAHERITAGYVMAELKLGSIVTLIPGVRYEKTFLEYTGTTGTTRNNEQWRFEGKDSTATRTSDNILPMVHLKIEPVQGLSFRFAATKTLSRPNFLNLTPFEQRSLENQKKLYTGSIDLKIPTAWNYDAMISWYSKFGLVSVGAFYKEIYDVDINVDFFDYSGDRETNPFYGWIVYSPINLDKTTSVKGIEAEVQTNFRFLPKPLDGIVFSGNFSIIRSEAYYPFFYLDYPPPDYLPTVLDTFRVKSLQGQADFIANLTMGYEKGGFAGNVSMNYQGVKFVGLGNTEFQDVYDDEYLRWDATLTYKFNRHWQIIANLVNIFNESERSYIYLPEQPSSIQQYGSQFNLGVRYRF